MAISGRTYPVIMEMGIVKASTGSEGRAWLRDGEAMAVLKRPRARKMGLTLPTATPWKASP